MEVRVGGEGVAVLCYVNEDDGRTVLETARIGDEHGEEDAKARETRRVQISPLPLFWRSLSQLNIERQAASQKARSLTHPLLFYVFLSLPLPPPFPPTVPPSPRSEEIEHLGKLAILPASLVLPAELERDQHPFDDEGEGRKVGLAPRDKSEPRREMKVSKRTGAGEDGGRENVRPQAGS